MRELKFKILDKEKFEVVNYLNCSIDINGEGIQSFDKDGIIEGTEKNKHLIPLQYTEINDVNGNEIYEGMEVHQVSVLFTSPDINFVGEVRFYDGSWWIDNGKESVLLFNEACENTIIKEFHSSHDNITKAKKLETCLKDELNQFVSYAKGEGCINQDTCNRLSRFINHYLENMI